MFDKQRSSNAPCGTGFSLISLTLLQDVILNAPVIEEGQVATFSSEKHAGKPWFWMTPCQPCFTSSRDVICVAFLTCTVLCSERQPLVKLCTLNDEVGSSTMHEMTARFIACRPAGSLWFELQLMSALALFAVSSVSRTKLTHAVIEFPWIWPPYPCLLLVIYTQGPSAAEGDYTHPCT